MMTKSLIKKEFRITAHPMTYVMLFFGAMVLIPNYPYTISIFYVCLALFFDFINARENKDFYFMEILPVSKKDIVKSKCIFTVILEMISLLITVPFAVLSVKINPNGDNLAGIDANVAFFGIAFLIYGVFNFVFLTNFFKSAYKVGVSFIKAVIPIGLIMIATETSAHIPGISVYIDSTTPDGMMGQIPVLVGGMVIYVFSFIFTLKKSISNFEMVDL